MSPFLLISVDFFLCSIFFSLFKLVDLLSQNSGTFVCEMEQEKILDLCQKNFLLKVQKGLSRIHTQFIADKGFEK